MSAENKAVVRRWIEEVWNRGNLAVLDQLVDADFVSHDAGTPQTGAGPAGARKLVNLYRTAFPDLQVAIEDMVAEDGKVVVRWTSSGTYKHTFGGLPGTGKKMSLSGISIYRIKDGKIAELWSQWDYQALVQQLGVQGSAPR